MKTRIFPVMLVVLLACAASLAQKNELAVTVGANFAGGNSVFGKKSSFAYGGYYANRLAHVPLAALYVELPVVAATDNGLQQTFANAQTATFNYSTLFVTPGLKVKFGPELPVSFYLATGVGFARYHASTQTRSAGTFSGDSSRKGVWDVGGGIDWKVAPFFSVRGEVRDFRTGSPSLSGLKRSSSQDNIVPQAGLVFRF